MIVNINCIIKTISEAIKSEGLDPWRHITSDTVSPGSLNLGVCSASVYASYSVDNFLGLSNHGLLFKLQYLIISY